MSDNKVFIQQENLTNIANAIRTKNETEQTYYPQDMAQAILDIETGVDTSDATATADDILKGKTAYVNSEKVQGIIDKTTADAIIGTSTDTVAEFRRNILNTLCSNLSYQDESGINYRLYPQKYGTGNVSLDKPISIYFVYDNPDESCYDVITIATGNWPIKTGGNAWYVSASRTEHYVACPSGMDWRNQVVFEHYRIDYNYNFVNRQRQDKYKTHSWGNKSMNSLFNISSCLYKNLLLVSPNYLNTMISNVSSFAIYKDRAGSSSFPSLNNELNLILSEKTEKILPKNIKSGVTILNVTGTVEELNGQTKTIVPTTTQQTITPDTNYNGITSIIVNAVDSSIDSNIKAENIKKDVTILGVTGTIEEGIDTSDATATAEDIVFEKTAYVNGQKITGDLRPVANIIGTIDELYVQTDNFNLLTIKGVAGSKHLVTETTTIEHYITPEQLLPVIGLTPDKIKAGETILGMTGTYVGDGAISQAEYNTAVSTASNILGEEQPVNE